jgi:hypothetical protein
MDLPPMIAGNRSFDNLSKELPYYYLFVEGMAFLNDCFVSAFLM